MVAARNGLLAIALLSLFACAPAQATESSVDAYAGEAAVLGKPIHHPHPTAKPGGSTGATEHSRRSSGGEQDKAGGATGSSSGKGPAGGSGPGAHANTPSPRIGGSTGAGASSAVAHSAGAPASTSTPAARASGRTPSIYPASTAGGGSIGAVDIVLIALGIAALVAVAVLLRRMMSPAS